MQIYHKSATIPANTPQIAPVVKDISFPEGVLELIHWRVSPGSLGVLSWFISAGQGQVWPLPVGVFMVADSESGDWRPERGPDTGDFQVTGFNTGAHPHTVRFELHVRYAEVPAGPRVLWTPAQLQGIPDLAASRRMPPPRGWPFQ